MAFETRSIHRLYLWYLCCTWSPSYHISHTTTPLKLCTRNPTTNSSKETTFRQGSIPLVTTSSKRSTPTGMNQNCRVSEKWRPAFSECQKHEGPPFHTLISRHAWCPKVNTFCIEMNIDYEPGCASKLKWTLTMIGALTCNKEEIFVSESKLEMRARYLQEHPHHIDLSGSAT